MAKHCVNRSSKEFLQLQEELSFINPNILAAKVSLWQEEYGLDEFPSVQDLIDTATYSETVSTLEDGDELFSFERQGNSFSSVPNSNSFEFDKSYNFYYSKYVSQEDREAVKSAVSHKVSQFFKDSEATSYKYTTNEEGGVKKITIIPSTGRKVKSLKQSVEIAKERASAINSRFLHPSFIEAGYTIATASVNSYGEGVISIQPHWRVIEAMSFITDKFSYISLEEYKERLAVKVAEKLGMKIDLSKMDDIQLRSLLDQVKNDPTISFSGAVLPNGEVITDLAQFRQLVEETWEDRNELEDYDEFFNNTTPAGFINPVYDVYAEQRKNQIEKVTAQIENLKSKRKIQGDKTLTPRIVQLQNIKESFEKDLAEFQHSTDLKQTIQEFFAKDFGLVQELIANPTIENIFLAQDAIKFIQINSEPRNLSDVLFPLRDEQGNTLSMPADLQQLMDEVRAEYNFLKDKVDIAVEDFFLNILGKYEDNLKKLYPEKELVEIKEEILKNIGDISLYDKYFLSMGKAMFADSDVLAQLIRTEYEIQEIKLTGRGQQAIQRINAILPKLETELGRSNSTTTYSKYKILNFIARRAMGVKDFLFKRIPKIASKKETILNKINYISVFYRKDSTGNSQPELIGRFTKTWDNYLGSFSSEISKKLINARAKKDWIRYETALKEKYDTLNSKTEFVDFRYLHDVFTNANDGMQIGTPEEASKYKQYIISKIGEYEYQELIRKQKDFLDEFYSKKASLENIYMANAGVSSIEDLDEDTKRNLEISIARFDPSIFIQNHIQNGNSEVVYNIGTQTYTKNHYMSYNTVIPKEQDHKGVDTGFYDKGFDDILNNPVLKESWEAFQEAVTLINENFAGTGITLNKRSLLLFQKSLIENYFDKNWYDSAKSLFTRQTLSNTRHIIANIISEKDSSSVVKEKEVTLPNNVASFNSQVQKYHDVAVGQLSSLFEIILSDTDTLRYDAISLEKRQKMFEILGVESEVDFFKTVQLDSKRRFSIKSLRQFSVNEVMETQTLDLPTMLKALVEQSIIHKARTLAKENIDIIRTQERKQNYELDRETAEENLVRKNAQGKSDFFYDNVVLNDKSQEQFGNISNLLAKLTRGKENISTEEYSKILGDVFIKNMNPEEKRLFKIYKQRLIDISTLEEKYQTNPEYLNRLSLEKAQIKAQIELMGKDYMFSTFWKNLINKPAIVIGMGYNLASPIFNYINAKSMFMSREGVYFTPGNGFPAWSFSEMNSLRHANPAYKKEWETMAAFVQKLNIVQDGTNELQRAERREKSSTPGLITTKWITKPLYGTELIEYYNQIPTVLAMLMDTTITDPDTNTLQPVFNGKEFPYHEVDSEGVLKLKDKYRTPENIANLEDFTSDKAALKVVQIRDAIRSLNGDYTTSGAILVKQNVFGQGMMLFKTWIGNYFHSHLAYNQFDLLTGETRDGFLAGSFANPKTRPYAVGMYGQIIGISALMLPATFMALPAAFLLGAGIAGSLSMALFTLYKTRGLQVSADNAPMYKVLYEVSKEMLKNNTKGLVELPVNMFANMGGFAGIRPKKGTLIELDSTLGGKLTSKREIDNYRTLQRKTAIATWSMLLTLLAQALLAGDEEEKELKGKKGSEQRKLHKEQYDKLRSEEYQSKKRKQNFLKNALQRVYDENNLGMAGFGSAYNMFLGEDVTLSGNSTLMGDYLVAIGKALSAEENEEEVVTDAKSMYYGDEKTEVTFKKAFLPSAFRNIGEEEWAFGFEGIMHREYENTGLLDKYYWTDYKKDISANKKIRVKEKAKITKQLFEEEYKGKKNMDNETIKTVNDLTFTEKEIFNAKIKAALNAVAPKPSRKAYTKDQQKKE